MIKEVKGLSFTTWILTIGYISITLLNVLDEIVLSPNLLELILSVYQVILILIYTITINTVFRKYFLYLSRTSKDAYQAQVMTYLSPIVRFSFWSLAFILLLGVLNIPTAGIVTAASFIGLGITYSMRRLIRDFLGSFVIILTKTFKVGDTVKVDKYKGKVKKITLKYTLLEDKNSADLIVPNHMFTEKSMRNYFDEPYIYPVLKIEIETPRIAKYQERFERIEKRLYREFPMVTENSINFSVIEMESEKQKHNMKFELENPDELNHDKFYREFITTLFKEFKTENVNLIAASVDEKSIS